MLFTKNDDFNLELLNCIGDDSTFNVTVCYSPCAGTPLLSFQLHWCTTVGNWNVDNEFVWHSVCCVCSRMLTSWMASMTLVILSHIMMNPKVNLLKNLRFVSV